VTVPSYLSDEYSFSRVDTSDVADIIARFAADALALDSPWTDQGGGVYKSPVDADGRWFDLALTRVSQGVLEATVRTSAGVTVLAGRMYIDTGGGTATYIALGTKYFDIVAFRATGVEERVSGGLMDLSPESQTAHPYYYYANTYRDTAGTARTGTNITMSVATWYNGSYTFGLRLYNFLSCRSMGDPQFASLVSSGRLAMPVCISAAYSGTNLCHAGFMYNHYFVPSGLLPGMMVTLPLGSAAAGRFLVHSSSGGNCRLAVRCG